MRLVLSILLSLALVSSASAKEPVPTEVARAVQKIIIDAWEGPDPDCPDCGLPVPPEIPDDATVRGWLKTGVLKAIDISPAVEPDWLINTEHLDRAANWCGTGGCETLIYSPTSDGHYAKVLDTQLRLFKFRTVPGQKYKWMEVDFHGSVCGSFGVDACPWAYEWKGNGLGYSLRFIKGESLRTLPLPPAVDTEIHEPAMITQLVATQKATCAQHGGTFTDYSLSSRVPDLNGDGVDEWLYDGFMAYCNYPETADGYATPEQSDPCAFLACEQKLWLSAAHDTWREADWDTSQFHALILAYGKTPRVIELSSAPGTKPDDTTACDNYSLANCLQKPISVSPKP